MQQKRVKRRKSIKHRKLISVLLVISLVFTALPALLKYGVLLYDFTTVDVICLILCFVPSILLLLYIHKFSRKRKYAFIVPLIFIIIVIRYILSGFTGLTFLIVSLLPIMAFIVAMLGALDGFNKKVLVFIPLGIVLIYDVLRLISAIMVAMLLLNATTFLAYAALDVALLIFGLNNKIPSIISVSRAKRLEINSMMDSEQALRLLNDKMDLGLISKEEYQKQRMEIVNNL